MLRLMLLHHQTGAWVLCQSGRCVRVLIRGCGYLEDPRAEHRRLASV